MVVIKVKPIALSISKTSAFRISHFKTDILNNLTKLFFIKLIIDNVIKIMSSH